MKNILVTIMFFCVVIVALYACKKHKNPSAMDDITGNWKISFIATDMNGNGVLDASERQVDTSFNYTIITFSANGTGYQSYHGVPDPTFNFAINSTNTWLRITYPSYSDTSYLRIDNLTASVMILRDTSGSSTAWEGFTKQ